MDLVKSPLAPKTNPSLPKIDGVSLHVANTGIKYQNRPDLFIANFEYPVAVAGVFTKSTTCSPSVDWDRKVLTGGKASALIVNAGNANAFTGDDGIVAVEQTAISLAQELDVDADEVFVSSTGVIGEKLPTDKITSAIPQALANSASWEDAAQAICTTDTFIKMAYAKSGDATICGIAKGSGMIEPNMATMLAYIFTDADIEQSELQDMFSDANEQSFNSITVDSDTSTSDTALLFTTGIKQADEDFAGKLLLVMQDLAKQIIRDGEGATKFIEIEVAGANSDKSAKKIAKSIANSPLVKTAIAGEDANWGRIVAAIGKTEEEIDREKIEIKFGDYTITEKGAVAESYNEEVLSNYMKYDEIKISVDLNQGHSLATVWTCDLTHAYISINADYRS